jgi:cytochrome c oxidase subunit II
MIARVSLGLAAWAAALGPTAMALAEQPYGRPEPWQIAMQGAATPSQEGILWFHNGILLPIITLITLLVLALLVIVIVRFNAGRNPTPSRTTHNTLIEVLWTVVPILILVVIAIPSFRLLYLQRDIPQPDMTIKVIGNPSWNWTYEYPDLGLNEDGSAKVSFTAFLKPKEELKEGEPWLLAATDPVVVPVDKVVKLIVTSDPEGIIHAWTVPSFGMKIDAIPGRLNEDWIRVTRPGVYYGQCSELCGKDHAYMPIEVHALPQADFDAWAQRIVTAGAEEAKKFLAERRAARDKLAQSQ